MNALHRQCRPVTGKFSMTVSITDTARGQIEYNLLGQGKPILFIHGGHVTCREEIFQKGLNPMEYCFITPSRPGYGHTPLTNENVWIQLRVNIQDGHLITIL
jgi:pimeloyl-ACP methyl ester carboxylesterase